MNSFKCPKCGQRDPKQVKLHAMKLKMTRAWDVEKQALTDPVFGPLHLDAQCTACGASWQSLNTVLFERARNERIFL